MIMRLPDRLQCALVVVVVVMMIMVLVMMMMTMMMTCLQRLTKERALCSKSLCSLLSSRICCSSRSI